MHVNFLPPTTIVAPTFLHLPPAVDGAAKAGAAIMASTSTATPMARRACTTPMFIREVRGAFKTSYLHHVGEARLAAEGCPFGGAHDAPSKDEIFHLTQRQLTAPIDLQVCLDHV